MQDELRLLIFIFNSDGGLYPYCFRQECRNYR
jgi:hypothetical protein